MHGIQIRKGKCTAGRKSRHRVGLLLLILPFPSCLLRIAQCTCLALPMADAAACRGVHWVARRARRGNIIKESRFFSKLSVIFCSLWTPATSNKTAKYEWKTLKNYGLVICVGCCCCPRYPSPLFLPFSHSLSQALEALHTSRSRWMVDGEWRLENGKRCLLGSG